MEMLRDKFNKISGCSIPSRQLIWRAIQQERPDLAGLDPEVPTSGSSFTFLFDNEIIKAPLGTIHDQEPIVLQSLQGLGLNIPQITYVSASPNSFYGMTRLKGVTFFTASRHLNAEQQAQAAEDLAAFKVNLELKTAAEKITGLNEVISDDIKVEREIKDTLNVMEAYNIKTVLSDNNDAYARLTDYFDRVSTRESVFVHNDLHDDNVLIDPETMRLAGVIDFGSVRKTKVPEAEFTYASGFYEPAFCDAFQAAYFAKHPTRTAEDFQCYSLARHLRFELSASSVAREKALSELPQTIAAKLGALSR